MVHKLIYFIWGLAKVLPLAFIIRWRGTIPLSYGTLWQPKVRLILAATEKHLSSLSNAS